MTVKEWYKSIGLDWDNSSHTIKVEATGFQGVCPVYLEYKVEADNNFKDLVDCAVDDIDYSIRDDAATYIQDVSDYYDMEALDEAVENGEIDESDADMILDDAFAEAEGDSGEWYIWVDGTEEKYDLREFMEEV